MAKQEVIKPSTVPAVQRIDIQSFTVDTLKFGPGNIRAMYENAAKAAERMGKDTPKGKVYEAQSIAFGQVVDALSPEGTPAPNDLARAGIVVRKTAGWYRETVSRSGRKDPAYPLQELFPKDDQIIANNQAIAFSASLEAMGQLRIVEQINVEIRAEKASTT